MKMLGLVLALGIVLGLTSSLSGEEKKQSMISPPRFEEPRPGNTVDKSFKVDLEGIPEGTKCVSIMQEQATILISRDILEYLRIAKPKDTKTEEERMALINGKRAEILLSGLMDNIKDDRGCTIVQSPYDQDAQYLISELLKSGQAGVIDNSTNKPVDHIYVRYKAFVAGPLIGKGDIIFSFAEKSASFLIILWWVS